MAAKKKPRSAKPAKRKKAAKHSASTSPRKKAVSRKKAAARPARGAAPRGRGRRAAPATPAVPAIPESPGEHARVHAPNCVTIFGAGVAGLSAAHELIERGFRVQVWEPCIDERKPERGCDIGGMARTQWSAVPWVEERELSASQATYKSSDSLDDAVRTRPILHLPWVIYLKRDRKTISVIVTARSVAKTKSAIKAALREMATETLDNLAKGQDVVYCEVQRRTPTFDTGKKRATEIVEKINDEIEGIATLTAPYGDGDYGELLTVKLTRPGESKDPNATGVLIHIAFLDGFPEGLPNSVGERISFRLRERWIPGEHGFRVFPSYYYHLFDTMRRTPILEPTKKSPIGADQERSVSVNANRDKYVETGRTVFDNLQSTTSQVFAPGTGKPSVFSRSMPTSFEEIRDWLHLLLKGQRSTPDVDGGLGLSLRDLGVAQVKFLQYLTSCEKRRVEYEELSWLEFLGGEAAYTKTFIDVINRWPRALVAMNAKECDARTEGSAYVQLMLDNLKSPGYRDGTLVGPTTVAWLEPWRRYLEAQGVEFIHGRLVGFNAATAPDGQKTIWPAVDCFEPRYSSGTDSSETNLMPGYFVLALPALEAKRLATDFKKAGLDAGMDEAELDASDLMRTRRLFEHESNELYVDAVSPRGQLRHMVGIQYYFDEDIEWRDGHYYLPLSPWGLTAISQIRYWQERHDWEHGYRGILSVVFTVTDAPGGPHAKTVWESEPDEIAEAVWAQIRSALDGIPMPKPTFWHLDSGFQREGNKYRNYSPLLISEPGKWADRPGELRGQRTSRGAEKHDDFGKYSITAGYVCAGTQMKTYTRLTTMEAANESARHAVNAILKDSLGERNATPCTIWPLDEREPRDFAFLRELDEMLYDKGLDHFIEILDLSELVGRGLIGSRPKVVDPLDPLSILAKIQKTIRDVASE